ncbi:uncharacterized protein LOC107005622 [Solanum pennellii]|uniref:Uncharacterized protein LOC107005622 n=1 Tax=Solanum pennellii TaxID=28526 RepID=A0ABM1FPE2_SOLPN|nr:uncharacterized protein LOC107005622 [Solanum pennellii]
MAEQNLPVIAKKIWNIVRVAFFMLRKGISKRKLMLDLNLIMKRGKIASKAAMQNLMFHHMTHQFSFAATTHRGGRDKNLPFSPQHNEYEFSCSNTPNFQLPSFNFNKKNKNKYFFPKSQSQAYDTSGMATHEDDVIVVNAAVMKALEMIHESETASPGANYLPGFGRTPMVRQLRVTDSPFPLNAEGDSHVDEAAEAFISKFYRNLRWQASPCAK